MYRVSVVYLAAVACAKEKARLYVVRWISRQTTADCYRTGGEIAKVDPSTTRLLARPP